MPSLNIDFQTVFAAIAALVSCITLPVAVFSVLLLVRQTILATRATRASVYQSVPELMIRIDQVFLDHPELRSCFYKGEGISETDVNHERANIIAEIILDFMEHVTTIAPSLPEYQWDSWLGYFRFIYQSSPVLRRFWSDNYN